MSLVVVEGREVIDLRGALPVRSGTTGYPLRPLEGISMVVVHYSGVAGDCDSFQIAVYQTSKSEGELFPEIAYSFVVCQGGRIEQCHDLEKRSWHAGGRNNDAGIGICLPGNGWPTGEQIQSTAALIRALCLELERSLRVVGHKELSATECPGPYWDQWKGDLVAAGAEPSSRVLPPVVMGFRAVYDYLGVEKCGMPLTPEQYDGRGDSTQRFSRCEMRWDKGSNRVWVKFEGL